MRSSRIGAVIFVRDPERVAAFYSRILDLDVSRRDEDHVVLESTGVEIVVHRIPDSIPADDGGTTRSRAAVKLVFLVPSLTETRQAVDRLGGAMEPVEREWTYSGTKVCDGRDPEGNVIQFRERNG